jgi:hypothetical protein
MLVHLTSTPDTARGVLRGPLAWWGVMTVTSPT